MYLQIWRSCEEMSWFLGSTENNQEWYDTVSFTNLAARAFLFSSSALSTFVPWPNRSRRAFFLASSSEEEDEARPNLAIPSIQPSISSLLGSIWKTQNNITGFSKINTPLSPGLLLLFLLYTWRSSPKSCRQDKWNALYLAIVIYIIWKVDQPNRNDQSLEYAQMNTKEQRLY